VIGRRYCALAEGVFAMTLTTNIARENEQVEVRCCGCGGRPKLVRSILDPRNGQTLRLYDCECGVQRWTTSSE
jgi:hypothetical protein